MYVAGKHPFLRDYIPGEKSYRLRSGTSERHSTAGQKDYTMKAVKDDGTRLMYRAQDRAISRREGHHVRDEDAGRVRVLSRRRFVQEQYFGIRQQLRGVILDKFGDFDRMKINRAIEIPTSAAKASLFLSPPERTLPSSPPPMRTSRLSVRPTFLNKRSIFSRMSDAWILPSSFILA